MRLLAIANGLAFAALLGLNGCAGVGVVATSDPRAKLADAGDLFDRQDRPLIAERLIREAIEIYQKQNDEVGLAEAYRAYGFFFRSPSIEGKWSNYYRKNGFLEPNATFGGRYWRSVEYFAKSQELFAKHQKYDALTNVNLNLGHSYLLIKEREKACAAYDESLKNYRQNIDANPGAKPALPTGYASYEQYLAEVKERARCK